MKQLLAFLFISFTTVMYAQEEFKVPRFQKTAIGNSGCFAYMPPGEIAFEIEYSPDSSMVYSGEISEGEYGYAVIVVKMNGTILETEEEKNDMLVSYLDFLQSSFSITDAAGYGMGHTLEKFPDAVGILDYWVDADGDVWEIKGWADSNTLGIMMIYGPTDYPNFSAQQVYLDGFRFY